MKLIMSALMLVSVVIFVVSEYELAVEAENKGSASHRLRAKANLAQIPSPAPVVANASGNPSATPSRRFRR